ncbi:L-histidine N(alpha)-methyltransferase [Pseudonocardia sp. KRD291]|uniref:L-histidine N(alpha)-methyltransferase n=1 Tax=Pseudonocardia sp. KRD291 TaxID=2792007 RepID=UPI001C49F1B5|nr:L-histidine N(alpha)-methyltransferase [Pseudonocardia sp. KRD291]MBW0103009.1 L-histidine N(alpha)-methyltransferase [Pseudonocardia sp. KRD291]
MNTEWSAGGTSAGTGLIRLDVHLTEADAAAALRADVASGLTAHPKELPPKWFYDARGSELFEQITDLPEYYPFRTERSLLTDSVADIARASGAQTVVELGSGSSTKTRLLLDAFRAAGTLGCYVPQDVSESALRGAIDELADRYPGLALHGVVGDFTKDLDRLPGAAPGGRRMIAFLGGTIGNLLPRQRHEFLTHVRSVLEPGEQLLVGTGLVTDPAVIVPAYDDSAGVTAEFNRNVLHVLNRELGANFDVEAFAHVAAWDADNEWLEMRLRAERDMDVRVSELDLDVSFAAGEEMRTEISGKFRPSNIDSMVVAAGFETTRRWTDPDERFALTLATAV